MKKTLPLILALLLTLLCFTSCGHVSSLRTLKFKARSNGKCKYIRCEEGEGFRTAYFEDELGFEYYIKSYMSEINIDGSSFGSVPSTTSDFEEKYFRYLCDTVNAKYTDSSVYLTLNSFSEIKMITQGELVTDDVVTMGREFTKLEDRGRFIDSIIPVYTDPDDYDTNVGSYGVDQDRYLDINETAASYYMDRITEYARMTGAKKKVKPEYARYEHMRYDSVPGLSQKDLVSTLGEPDPQVAGVDVYYFTVDGTEYFITNVLVYDESSYSEYYFYNSYISDPYAR